MGINFIAKSECTYKELIYIFLIKLEKFDVLITFPIYCSLEGKNSKW